MLPDPSMCFRCFGIFGYVPGMPAAQHDSNIYNKKVLLHIPRQCRTSDTSGQTLPHERQVFGRSPPSV